METPALAVYSLTETNVHAFRVTEVREQKGQESFFPLTHTSSYFH